MRSQEIQYLASVLWSKHWFQHAMPSKLENALPLFISVRKLLGSVLTSGLTFNFTQVKSSIFKNSAFNFKSRRFIRIYFFLCIRLQERLIKIQCAHIRKSYLKFSHVPEFSHSVYRGINPPPPSNAPSLYFAKPSANYPNPFLGNSPYILFFVTPLP